MVISKDRAHQISLLQENLQTIRKIAGWTIEDLGDRIGISKQTISNLENTNTRMSLTQYIAIRAVLDYEIQEHPENDVLPKVVHILLDEEAEISEEDYAKVKKFVDTVAAAAAGGADKSMLSQLLTGVIGTAAVGVGLGLLSPLGVVGGVATSLWLKSVLEDDKTTKR